VAEFLDAKGFRHLFDDRVVVFTNLPSGSARQLAERANERVGRGDATLRTRSEFDSLFTDLSGGVDTLRVRDDTGALTQQGTIVQQLQQAAVGADTFFDQPLYVISITDWPSGDVLLKEPVTASGAARLSLWRADPADPRHIPSPGREGVLFTTGTFSLMNTGNMTLYAPKRSWKVDVEPGDDDDRTLGLERLNLKSMYNDPTQMREALAWHLFGQIGIPAARHTYARVALNGAYRGLYSVIEQVDKRFLNLWFGKGDRGNLYKAYCGDIGCATLEHRRDAAGDDSGRQYRGRASADRMYRLKTNEDDPAANSYDDLAALIRVINGVGMPAGSFGSDAYREAVEQILDVWAFLRWASMNVLLGSWDNYFATPANYYLYNSGRRGAPKKFLDSPYFTFIPWDYDNSFGIDYSGTDWHYTDLLDWPANTVRHWHRDGNPDTTSRIPLVQNVLVHHDFVQYYLDHLEHLLSTEFTPDAIAARMAATGGTGLWQRISQSAYLEADFPHALPFTGRQFTNDEVYRAGYAQEFLRHDRSSIQGIYHYVRMRSDSAWAQLKALQAAYPAGASGANFGSPPERVPADV
jgi:CotH kinase protein